LGNKDGGDEFGFPIFLDANRIHTVKNMPDRCREWLGFSMGQRSNFGNADASDVRRAFQQAAAKALRK
jgi:hypothetical protein